jgi:hypothetical protein
MLCFLHGNYVVCISRLYEDQSSAQIWIHRFIPVLFSGHIPCIKEAGLLIEYLSLAHIINKDDTL